MALGVEMGRDGSLVARFADEKGNHHSVLLKINARPTAPDGMIERLGYFKPMLLGGAAGTALVLSWSDCSTLLAALRSMLVDEAQLKSLGLMEATSKKRGELPPGIERYVNAPRSP